MGLVTALTWTAVGVFGVGWVPAAIQREMFPSATYGLWAISTAVDFIVAILEGDIGWAVTAGVLTAVSATLWWRNGGGGKAKRVARELGARSRARIDALAEKLTPSPIPVPGGVR